MFDLQQAAKKDSAFIQETWEKLDKKLSVTAERSRDKIPYTTVNGVHNSQTGENIDGWTNGFWPGLMWLIFL